MHRTRHQTSLPRTWTAWLLTALLLAFAQPLLAGESGGGSAGAGSETIGRILLAIGTVEATGRDGTVRTLRRRSMLFEGDTVRTGPRGRAQIIFTDRARLSMRPNTEIDLDEYRYQPAEPPARSRFRMNLKRGGFRTITGGIADRNRANYRVSTPFAVIGVRGTDWSSAITDIGAGDQLFVSVDDGTIFTQNDGGSLDLGDAGNFDVAVVNSFTEAPQGLDALPGAAAMQFDMQLGEPAPDDLFDDSDDDSPPESGPGPGAPDDDDQAAGGPPDDEGDPPGGGPGAPQDDSADGDTDEAAGMAGGPGADDPGTGEGPGPGPGDGAGEPGREGAGPGGPGEPGTSGDLAGAPGDPESGSGSGPAPGGAPGPDAGPGSPDDAPMIGGTRPGGDDLIIDLGPGQDDPNADIFFTVQERCL